jgi:hypothetical protein
MNQSSLFAMNADNGIKIQNIDAAFGGSKVKGKLAQKCTAVAPRSMHYLENHTSAVMLYAEPPQSFMRYFKYLYGFDPNVLFPASLPDWHTDGLSLIYTVLDDRNLVEHIAKIGRSNNWSITPFIPHPLVFELSDRTGLPVNGMDRVNVLSDKVGMLNDKSIFQKLCRGIGIPTPKSHHARGWRQMVYAARAAINRHGAVMLRCARAAGGLGNLKVTREELNGSDLGSYLERTIGHDRDNWENDTVLVERVLDVASSPSTLVYIEENGEPRFVADSMQRLKDMKFIGAQIPSGIPNKVLRKLVSHALDYARVVSDMGGRGWCGIDWGLLRNGDYVAFESNYRFGGNNHALAIRRKLDYHGVSISNDALTVSNSLRFEEVWGKLDSTGLGWDHKSREGIVVSIPPSDGSMGYVALAPSASRAEELSDDFERHFHC